MTSSGSFRQLPIIDIGPLFTTIVTEKQREEKEAVVREIHKACKDVGFLYITNHSIPETLTQEVLRLAREFFFLPQSEKEAIAITKCSCPTRCRGYQRLGENITQYQKDWHEGIDFYRDVQVTTQENRQPLDGLNQWPSSPPDFKPTFLRYINEMFRLGKTLMSAFALGLGLEEDYFEKYTDNGFWGMRVIGYPPLQSATNTSSNPNDPPVGVSCGEHTDYGCLTIVNQDSKVCALQVKNKDNEWINADPVPNAFVVNLGDMLKRWSNNVYQSTPHRVINLGTCYRVSIPFFFEPNYDAVITPVKSCVQGTEQHYEPIVYGTHLSNKVSNNFLLQSN